MIFCLYQTGFLQARTAVKLKFKNFFLNYRYQKSSADQQGDSLIDNISFINCFTNKTWLKVRPGNKGKCIKEANDNEPAQIQPKFQFLIHKNLPPRDSSILTLISVRHLNNLIKTVK